VAHQFLWAHLAEVEEEEGANLLSNVVGGGGKEKRVDIITEDRREKSPSSPATDDEIGARHHLPLATIARIRIGGGGEKKVRAHNSHSEVHKNDVGLTAEGVKEKKKKKAVNPPFLRCPIAK